jgi:hypothetical protein
MAIGSNFAMKRLRANQDDAIIFHHTMEDLKPKLGKSEIFRPAEGISGEKIRKELSLRVDPSFFLGKMIACWRVSIKFEGVRKIQRRRSNLYDLWKGRFNEPQTVHTPGNEAQHIIDFDPGHCPTGFLGNVQHLSSRLTN